jgi:hypothetical protein
MTPTSLVGNRTVRASFKDTQCVGKNRKFLKGCYENQCCGTGTVGNVTFCLSGTGTVI